MKELFVNSELSTEDYHYLFDNVPVGIYRSTPDGRLLIANPYFRSMMGIDNGKDIVDLNWLSKKLSYSREEFLYLIKTNGFVQDFVAEYKKSDGSMLYYLETAKAFFDDDGNVKFVEGIVTDITNFKIVQDALYESEEKYRLLFEKSEDAILIIDENRWSDCNEAALKLFGYKTKSEIVGLTPFDISPEQQSANEFSEAKAMLMINHAYQNGFNRFDWVHEDADGNPFYADVSLTAIPYKKKILLFTMIRDISAKRKAEEHLKISEEKFRLLFENIHDAIVISNKQGIVIDCNKSVSRISGYRNDEIIGLTIWEYADLVAFPQNEVFPDEQSYQNLYDILISGKDDKSLETSIEMLIRRKDGSIGVISYKIFVLELAYEKLICFIVSDMTEVKRINDEIIAEKERFETLLKTSPVAILMIAFDGTIQFASQRIFEYFRNHNKEFKGINNIKSLTHVSNHKLLDEAIAYVKDSGSMHNFEIDVYPFDGKVFRADVNASLIRNKLHEPEAIIATIMDVSTRKQAEKMKEQALQATLEALEKKHEALDLINTSARLASIGVIAGGIIHEISQPLNAIRIGSEGIMSWNKSNGDVLPSAIISMLAGISSASIRIEDIVKHMRSLWLGSSSEAIETVDLNECVRSALNLARMRAQSHEIHFEISLFDDTMLVDANKVHLELIINNLITNSVNSLDKCKKKEKIIRIATYRQKDIGYLVVYDNGKGLPEVNEHTLFDPFYSTRQNEGGTGLGLAIVKMFLDKYNATVQPMNNADGGATFLINFKLKSGEQVYV